MSESIIFQKLIYPGQIKKGDKLVCRCQGEISFYTAKEILYQGTDREEILLKIKKNIYFMTSLVLNGTSWAKDVYIIRIYSDLDRMKDHLELSGKTGISI